MKAPIIAVCLAVVAVGCDRQPARDPSYGSTTTTSAPSEHYGKPSSATIYSTKTDERSRPASRGTTATEQPDAPAYGARGLEQQRPDGSSTTWGGSRNTNDRTLADPNAKQGTAPESSDRAESTKKDGDQDRSGGTVSAVDQGNSSSETRITADIRKQLVVSSTLSLAAKNVKVITTGSKVTLRGSVKSEQEKAEVEGIARTINGVTDVDNQLEVKK